MAPQRGLESGAPGSLAPGSSTLTSTVCDEASTQELLPAGASADASEHKHSDGSEQTQVLRHTCQANTPAAKAAASQLPEPRICDFMRRIGLHSHAELMGTRPAGTHNRHCPSPKPSSEPPKTPQDVERPHLAVG